MHELSICRSVAGIVEEHAAGRAVSRVHVRVGHFRQVVPTTLAYCWDIVVADGPLAGARLDIDHVPARIRCITCEAISELTVPVLRCASCGGIATELLSGEEMLVTAIDVEEPAHEP